MINSAPVGDRGAQPHPADERNTFLAPLWLALGVLILWGLGAALLTTLYGLADTHVHPDSGFLGELLRHPGGHRLLSVHRVRAAPGGRTSARGGPAPRRLAPGIMGRTMTVWLLGSGVPVLGIALTALFALTLGNLTRPNSAWR